MTDPALDDDKATGAVAAAVKAAVLGLTDDQAFATLAALNEQDVVLCDELALASWRQLIADLRISARGTSPSRHLSGDESARVLLSRHGLA